MQTDIIIYTSPRSIHNHIFQILIDPITDFYYIKLIAYSESINLIGIYPTPQQAKNKISKLLEIL